MRAGGQLVLAGGIDLLFYLFHDGVDILHAHRALLTCVQKPLFDFAGIEGLAPHVLFYHHQRRGFDLLIGGEAPAAAQAFAASADGAALLRGPGINHAAVQITAVLASHGASSFLSAMGYNTFSACRKSPAGPVFFPPGHVSPATTARRGKRAGLPNPPHRPLNSVFTSRATALQTFQNGSFYYYNKRSARLQAGGA